MRAAGARLNSAQSQEGSLFDFIIEGKVLERLREGARTQVPTLQRTTRAETEARGVWLAEDGQTPLGEPFVLEVPDEETVEAFHPSGAIQHVPTSPGARFSATPPDGAAYLMLSQFGLTTKVARRDAEKVGPFDRVVPQSFGAPDATFRFPVFSERFRDQQAFYAAVQSLADWILTIPPFNDDPVQGKFGLNAFFWPTEERYGHFNTEDFDNSCSLTEAPKAFHGRNDKARDRLEPYMLDGMFGLVLVNSPTRGGAGGIARRGYPAWASTAECRGEKWHAIALHEISHALGLADEYSHAASGSASLGREPNFAATSARADVLWWDQLTEPSPDCIYDVARQIGLDASAMRRYVGLFAGARYSPDHFRPSLNCLMKDTPSHFFCKVCSDHIVSKVGSS
jgi:hypothetical protein